MKKLIWVIIIIAVVLGIWMLTKKPAQAPQETVAPVGDNSARQSTFDDLTPPDNTTVALDTAVTLGAVKELTVTGSNFRFAPSTITVKKGDTVKLTFINSGGTHDWRINEFKAATKMINSGESETITFVADKAGTFEYYCSVGNHRAMGMKGTLTVTE